MNTNSFFFFGEIHIVFFILWELYIFWKMCILNVKIENLYKLNIYYFVLSFKNVYIKCIVLYIFWKIVYVDCTIFYTFIEKLCALNIQTCIIIFENLCTLDKQNWVHSLKNVNIEWTKLLTFFEKKFTLYIHNFVQLFKNCVFFFFFFYKIEFLLLPNLNVYVCKISFWRLEPQLLPLTSHKNLYNH